MGRAELSGVRHSIDGVSHLPVTPGSTWLLGRSALLRSALFGRRGACLQQPFDLIAERIGIDDDDVVLASVFRADEPDFAFEISLGIQNQACAWLLGPLE